MTARAGKAKNGIRADVLFAKIAILLLCLCTIRSGHEDGTLPVLPVCFICVLLLLPYVATRRVMLDKGYCAFVFLLPILLLVQTFTAGSYFRANWAISAIVLFLLFFGISAMISTGDGLRRFFWKCVNSICLVGCACIFITEAGYLAGMRLNTLPVAGDWLFNAWEFTGAYRPCGLFSEASHFAELSLLSAYYFLYVRKNIPAFIVIATAELLSTSSLGIIGILILALVYVFFFSFSSERMQRSSLGRAASILRVALIILSIVLITMLVSFLENSDSWLATRIMDGGTYGMRVGRSYELFALETPPEQIFGIGLQNQGLYLNAHGIILPSDMNETLVNREFAATIGYVLCTCGIVGLAAYVSPLVRTLFGHSSTSAARVLSAIFFYVLFTCCVFSRSILILWMTAFFFGSHKASSQETVPNEERLVHRS